MMAGRGEIGLAEAILKGNKQERGALEWWRGAIFYQIYLRSFRDSNGDGLGDLRGVTEKLDYLAELCVDGIWLTPFYKSPQRDFGYDVSDLCAVDPRFGETEDLLELIDGAHERGLRVLADFIPCHTSDEHPWFAESRKSRDNDKADWYVWADAAQDGTAPNNWLSSFGGPAWTWEPRRSQYYYHPFFAFQPALNLRNEETLEAVLDAMRFWRNLGIDGFRLDAVQCLCWDEALRSNPPMAGQSDNVAIGGGPNNPFARQEHFFDRDVPYSLTIIEKMRSELTHNHPDLVLIGELADLDTSRLAEKYSYGDGRLHAVYDFDLIHKATSTRQWIETMRVRSAFLQSGTLMNVLTNHDTERAVSSLMPEAVEAGRREEAAKLLLFLQATLRGGAIVYQGEELGLPQPYIDPAKMQDPWGINLYPDFHGRDGVRVPFPWCGGHIHGGFTESDEPWLPMPEDYLPLAADRQEKDDRSVLSFFRDLLSWRRRNPWLRTKDQSIAGSDTSPLLIFSRGDEMTFVANLSLEDHFLPCDAGLIDVPHSRARAKRGGVHLAPLAFAALDGALSLGQA